MLLTDHNVRETLSITDRAYIIYEGRILRQGTSRDLVADSVVRKIYLGEKFRMPELEPGAQEAEDKVEADDAAGPEDQSAADRPAEEPRDESG